MQVFSLGVGVARQLFCPTAYTHVLYSYQKMTDSSTSHMHALRLSTELVGRNLIGRRVSDCIRLVELM